MMAFLSDMSEVWVTSRIVYTKRLNVKLERQFENKCENLFVLGVEKAKMN